ncbi:unnamed protein product [Rotaria magnacalcarata]|uniref:C2H2-type domain-containing protein n=1 Tax=Rotaria magnacalcarata TaxID=392030 RepID=A0A816CZN0_9BILA|nr:unnamed protein product [Rotaria magnacalcarata]
MMMDTTVDTDGTAFICPECSFNGKSLPELISHLNDAHSEETASRSEAPPKNASSLLKPEKRSRRKPAFSHQIVSQVPRQSSTLFSQQTPSNIESDPNQVLNRISTPERNATKFIPTVTDDSSIQMISDENTNINVNSKDSLNSISAAAKRNPNVLHSILSQQRPIAPKNGSPTATKVTPISSPSLLPLVNSSPGIDNSFYSPTNHLMQPYKKNFQCKMCRLTYKNFHDCTAHIRKKHEIDHALAGRYVEKLDEDIPLPPSATGNYKFRIKGKSLPPPQQANSTSAMKRTSLTPMAHDDSTKILQCTYCSFTTHWSKEIIKHQRIVHSNYPPHILQNDYVHEDNQFHDEIDDDGLSALLIDPVRAFGEVIDTIDNTNGNDYEDAESQDEQMMMGRDIDDDEDDALWKYQQEINDLSESGITTAVNHERHNSNHLFAKQLKKFRCPHCEHASPTLTKLKLHVATHINIKPFMCSICGWRANLRWYIQCHAKKRHPNMNFDVLQLSHEEAEQTINAYMKERGLDSKLNLNGQDSKRYYQCSLCQFRSSHPKFIEQHIHTNHLNKSFAKMIVNKRPAQTLPAAPSQPQQLQLNNKTTSFLQTNGHTTKQIHTNDHDDKIYSKFMIKPPTKSNYQKLNGDYQDEQNKCEMKSQTLYNRSSLIQSDGTMRLPDSSQIVYPKFSSHPHFNPNRLFYCALCYRGYRWRYDVKRHHKTSHESPEIEAARGLSMSPKSVKRRNKEFNRNFRYLEYVPQVDGLISASMSSVNNHYSVKQENGFDDERMLGGATTDDDDEGEESQDNELKLSITDAHTVDITEDEATALLMIEPQKSDNSSIILNDHPDDAVIVFEDDRRNSNESKDRSSLLSNDTSKLAARTSTGLKPYRCPYCFYRTNWRTDSLRHIRARHKIEPSHDGYLEMTAEEAERTYAEYERTFGFVVSKKVLGRYTDFRHIEWNDLQKSIWEKIKDKIGYEQIIYDRLRPDNYSETKYSEPTNAIPDIPPKPIVTPILNKVTIVKPKRMFACTNCAFRSHKLFELDKHICERIQKSQNEKPHGKFRVSLYQCSECSYRTIYNDYARKHIYLHRLKNRKMKRFYYCSVCGYNHTLRNRLTVHIAKHHPINNTLTTTISSQYHPNADFTIKQINLRRSFVERQLNNRKSMKTRVFYCTQCPHVSTSVLEHDHHRSCHEENSLSLYKCNQCTFASNSLLYTRQHNMLHSNSSRLLSLHIDTKNLKHLAISTIFHETLGKNRRYHCPFCKKFSSSTSSIVLGHIKNIHTGNSNQFDDSLIIGSDMAKEILALRGDKVTDDSRMDIS